MLTWIGVKGRVSDLRGSNSDSALKSLCFWIDGALKSQYFWIDADETKPLLGTTVLVSSLTGECRRRQARICHRKLPLRDMCPNKDKSHTMYTSLKKWVGPLALCKSVDTWYYSTFIKRERKVLRELECHQNLV